MTTYSETEPITTDLQRCARCGNDHKELTFQPLDQPMEAEGLRFTHWAPCPVNAEPIMMRIQELVE